MMSKIPIKVAYDCFQDIVSKLKEENEPARKISLLKELGNLLKKSSKVPIIKTGACLISPLLIKLAKDENELVASQALEAILAYFENFCPDSVPVLLSQDVIQLFYKRLKDAARNEDLAGKCLEALKMISLVHTLACFDSDGGAPMKVLSHINLFPTNLQREALSIVDHTFRLLFRIVGASVFMRTVPDLIKLLQDDNKLMVAKDATSCLIRIGLSGHKFSKREIDELSTPNLTERMIYFLSLGNQVLFDHTYLGSIKFLTELCSVSLETFKCLHSSTISETLKSILAFQPSNGGTIDNTNLVSGALMLLNQMLPPLSNQNDQCLKDKHTFLTDNSDRVLLLGIDVLPKLMQVFNFGERVDLSNVCLSLILKLIHWATPEKLENLLEENNISRFLSRTYNYKDLHVLKSALKLTALLLQSLPAIFYSFNREGVLYGIDNILSKVTGSSSSDQDPSSECQCYLESLQANAQTVLNCSLEEGYVYRLSQKIKDEYIASNSSDLWEGSRKISELTSKLDDYMKQANDSGAVEKGMNDTVQEILKVFTEESISVFELIRLGTLTSLVEYLSVGRGLEGYDDAIEKRFEYFATVCSTNTLLLSALQSALMYFESFPVIVIGKKETWVDAPQKRLVTSPSMTICFFNDIEDDMGEEEDQSEEEEDQFVAVDPFSSLKEIQLYLFESGFAKIDEQHDELIFHLEGKELDPYLTLYQAIIGQKIQWNEDFSVDQLWEKEHTLRFTRAPSSITTPAAEEYDLSSFFRHMFRYEPVPDLKKLSPVHEILFLLKLLEGTNRLMPHIMCRQKIETFASSEDANMPELNIEIDYNSQIDFVNRNLCEKLQSQMRDLSTIGAVPSWFVQLMDSCPFLFSFDTRCSYFKLAAYGQQPKSGDNSRNMQLSVAGWATRKVFVDRNSILESFAKLMKDFSSFREEVLEVQFHDEIGFGHGPTMEFYALASESFQDPGLGMWRGDEIDDQPNGLFPRPYLSQNISIELLHHFKLLGYIVGRALQDGRILDLNFSRAFYKLIIGKDLSLYDIDSIDATLGRTMKEFHALASRNKHLPSAHLTLGGSSIEDLGLTFTSVPGCPDTDIFSTNSDINENNLGEYVSLVTNATVRSGISRQMETFKFGLNLVFPIKCLHIFTEEELEHILCGEQDSWTQSNELEDHLELGGYTPKSPPIINLISIIQEFDRVQRRAFLKFVTGSPRLPRGGLVSLSPKMKIRRSECSNQADLIYPTAHTCFNFFDLPPYSTRDIMKEKLLYAIMDQGHQSFYIA